jgi:general secretion pathway protein G
MKKAFTMIELIFVIVILGILAAVAIPRIFTTRDDAQAVQATVNLRTLINDVTTNLSSKGYVSTDLNEMTGVELVDKGTATGTLKVGKEKCYEISVYDSGSDDIIAPVGGLEYSSNGKATDFDYIMIKAINQTKKLCKIANGLPEIRSILNNVPKKYKDEDVTTNLSDGEAGFIIIGGSNLYGRKGDRMQN